MGDWLQTLVARQSGAHQAGALADKIRSWLVAEGIVVAELSDSVLGGSGAGHRPGPNYMAAVHASDKYLNELVTNGVDVQFGRIVALDPQGESRWQCASCNVWHSDQAGLMDAVSIWYDGNDDAAVRCPSCAQLTRLSAVVTDPPLCCGHLALTFWNWPPLTDSFVNQLGTLATEPLTLVVGKL